MMPQYFFDRLKRDLETIGNRCVFTLPVTVWLVILQRLSPVGTPEAVEQLRQGSGRELLDDCKRVRDDSISAHNRACMPVRRSAAYVTGYLCWMAARSGWRAAQRWPRLIPRRGIRDGEWLGGRSDIRQPSDHDRRLHPDIPTTLHCIANAGRSGPTCARLISLRSGQCAPAFSARAGPRLAAGAGIDFPMQAAPTKTTFHSSHRLATRSEPSQTKGPRSCIKRLST